MATRKYFEVHIQEFKFTNILPLLISRCNRLELPMMLIRFLVKTEQNQDQQKGERDPKVHDRHPVQGCRMVCWDVEYTVWNEKL